MIEGNAAADGETFNQDKTINSEYGVKHDNQTNLNIADHNGSEATEKSQGHKPKR